jgi:hypothetical protein
MLAPSLVVFAQAAVRGEGYFQARTILNNKGKKATSPK